METYIILSEKPWHQELYHNLSIQFPSYQWILISKQDDFTLDALVQINPKKIFIPHWSYIISAAIYSRFDCVLFHMTDLPFGRGGSPLQNLIVRGIKETKISAIQVEKGIDTGPIYLKSPLCLNGSAQEIFLRASVVMEDMIIRIINEQLVPEDQTGHIVNFKRRKAEDSDLSRIEDLHSIYDYIRMLDADGYPNAFLEFGNFRLEFSGAKMKSDNIILADVRIIEK
ncbi:MULTISPECIES: methionyl-tRNA formyltransferase [Sphingobacterium]|uniref:methionyl-tRNA formyltransferase n=1 Tax=Sphingobacterium TaxID=28453 RepID=UPI001044C965|nr:MULTISPECIES: methionyl-tRNA formyltransferase [Sphingobacterium]MCW2262020.1 methionyl-tRNA formyltransferase [Sphingobacterium kitahiroshimense]TCR13232.1 methionyl-tRNA formyltransferase [Sphingobacterium sp. JUb78]